MVAAGDCIPSHTAANSIGVPLKNRHDDQCRVQSTQFLFTVNSLTKENRSPERVSFDRFCILPQKPPREAAEVIGGAP